MVEEKIAQYTDDANLMVDDILNDDFTTDEIQQIVKPQAGIT